MALQVGDEMEMSGGGRRHHCRCSGLATGINSGHVHHAKNRQLTQKVIQSLPKQTHTENMYRPRRPQLGSQASGK